jgi:hypothetical protein
VDNLNNLSKNNNNINDYCIKNNKSIIIAIIKHKLHIYRPNDYTFTFMVDSIYQRRLSWVTVKMFISLKVSLFFLLEEK